MPKPIPTRTNPVKTLLTILLHHHIRLATLPRLRDLRRAGNALEPARCYAVVCAVVVGCGAVEREAELVDRVEGARAGGGGFGFAEGFGGRGFGGGGEGCCCGEDEGGEEGGELHFESLDLGSCV